jgi:hypothetical protein
MVVRGSAAPRWCAWFVPVGPSRETPLSGWVLGSFDLSAAIGLKIRFESARSWGSAEGLTIVKGFMRCHRLAVEPGVLAVTRVESGGSLFVRGHSDPRRLLSSISA